VKKQSNFEQLITELKGILEDQGQISKNSWDQLARKYSRKDKQTPSKNAVIEYIKKHDIEIDDYLLKEIQMKPTRTISGVAPITIFTKPYKCSGNCIFCPTNKSTPKSYLPEEPGIQRALHFNYTPYEQVEGRIKSVEMIGHNANKIELIISGGTWDDYSRNYQIWYMLEVFRALNKLSSQKYSSKRNYKSNKYLKKLKDLQEKNKKSKHRSVGISIETRPDKLNYENITWYRRFGFTKIQVGVQTLDNEILKLNNRKHTLEQTKKGINLLRLAGFKIHIHWMCNLYGSNPKIDYQDFKKIFSDKNIKPDEIKIYPCSIIKGTELFKLFQEGKYTPYSSQELIDLLTKCKEQIPKYCRVNRLIRDIPSNLIVEGNKITNLRQHVQKNMYLKGKKCQCIRCREIKDKEQKDLRIETHRYKTNISQEYFIEYVTSEDKIAAFLRLSIYQNKASEFTNTKAMIRELHVYGQVMEFQNKSSYSSQHKGLGTKLLMKAEKIAKKNKAKSMAVIAAVGTRSYYIKRGYNEINDLGYLIKQL